MSIAAMVARRERLLGPGNPLFYEDPVHLVRGEGVWLFDADGRRYLDCYNNVPCVGHCHPKVVEALCRQAKLLNTHTRYLHENILDYAERLLGKFDGSLDRLALACTGSEANELALRIARFNNRRREASSAPTPPTTATPRRWPRSAPIFEPFEGYSEAIRMVPLAGRLPATEQPKRHGVGGRLRRRGAAGHRLLQGQGGEVRRHVGLPPSSPTKGCPRCRPATWRRPSAMCAAPAASMLRTKCRPALAAPAAGGATSRAASSRTSSPWASPWARATPFPAWSPGANCSTAFGCVRSTSTPLAATRCPAPWAEAVLQVIEEEGLVHNAAEVGEYVLRLFQELQSRHENIGDVRGRGLFFGMDLVSDRKTKAPGLRTNQAGGQRHAPQRGSDGQHRSARQRAEAAPAAVLLQGERGLSGLRAR